MKGYRFRTVLIAGILAVVAAILAATVGAIALTLDRRVRVEVESELGRSQRVFEDLQRYRQSLFHSEAMVVTEEPRLKAIAASDELNPATVMGVARELQGVLGSSLFLLADSTAHLLADTADPDATGQDLSSNAVVKDALAKGESDGIWIDGTRAFQVQGRQLAFGSQIVGALVIGYEIDNKVADTVHEQTGSVVAIVVDGTPVATSKRDGGAVDPGQLRATLPGVKVGARPAEVTLGGETYLGVAAPFPGYHGTADMHYVMLRSLDRALAAKRALVRLLLAIAAASIIAAIVLAAVTARALSRPLDNLVALTRSIARDEYKQPVQIRGPREVRVLGDAMNKMAAELATSRDAIATKQRLEREMEIAAKIQTSMVPKTIAVAGLEVAARMVTASEVGGDYYDVLRAPDGCWIGIGDVAGHGLTAGLVMMMMQSAISALVRQGAQSSPRDIVIAANAVLYENIRHRLANDEHVTMSLLRYREDGRVTFAGAHEEIYVYRAATKECESIETPGTWLGARADISSVTVDSEMHLAVGDVMLLYTDGVTEAMNAKGAQFGSERLKRELARLATEPVERIRDELLAAVDAWSVDRPDDITLMVVRKSA